MPPATPAPVLLGGGGGEMRAHGQYLALPGRAGTLSGGGSVRNSVTAPGEGQMSAGVGARTKVEEDDVEARIRKGDLGVEAQFEVEGRDSDAGFEPHDKDTADLGNKPYQHHQKYNLISSTSSRASSSMSVLTGTTGVTSVSASDVDVDEAMEHHNSKVVNQEQHVILSGFTSTRDDYSSPSPSPSPTAEASFPKSHTQMPKSTSTNAHAHSPKPLEPQSHSRSPTTTTTLTTTKARSHALHPAPASTITRRASSGGTSRSRSRPSLAVSGAPTSAKSKSRSRSRDAGGGGALAWGMTKKVRGGAGGGRVKLGGVSKGKLGGNWSGVLGKGLSRKGIHVDVGEGEGGQRNGETRGKQGEEREALNVRAEREYLAKRMGEREDREKELIQQQENHNQREGEREREGKKSTLFDIGSHSDNGSRSKQRTTVLETRESDYETDSDDEEDGSWASEEMRGDEVCGFSFGFFFY